MNFDHLKKILLLIAVFIFVSPAAAQRTGKQAEWNMFRGPNGSGFTEVINLPVEFGPEKNVLWKMPFPTGHSSPVLTGDLMFLTGFEDEKLFTICLSQDKGQVLWRKEAPRPRKEKLDSRNNPASPTPVTDGSSVFVFFPDYGLLAYDLKGNELWRLPLGPYNNLYGMGSSPVLADNKVILVCDQNTNSFIIGVDKKSGKTVWKKDRPEAKSGHSTPIVHLAENGETEVLVPGSFMLIAYSVETGERIWWTGGLPFEMKSTPVIQNDLLFINGYASPMNQPGNQVKIPTWEEAKKLYDTDKNGLLSKEELPEEPVYGWMDFVDLAQDGFLDKTDWNYFEAALASLNGMLAIRLGGSGDMTESNSVWAYRRAVPQLPSPLIYNDVLYMLNDGGFVTTFKPASGEVIQRSRLRGSGTQFYASPVAGGGKVFIVSRKGKVTVLKQGGSLETIAVSDLEEECYATPAIAEGKIYIRTVRMLYCFGLNK